MADMSAVLKLFHQARREKQINDALEKARRLHIVNLNNISDVMCMYSPFKETNLLVEIQKRDTLFRVNTVQFIIPQLTDMKPEYNYNLLVIDGTKDGLVIGSNTLQIYGRRVGDFMLATTQDVERISKTLPNMNKPKAKAMCQYCNESECKGYRKDPNVESGFKMCKCGHYKSQHRHLAHNATQWRCLVYQWKRELIEVVDRIIVVCAVLSLFLGLILYITEVR